MIAQATRALSVVALLLVFACASSVNDVTQEKRTALTEAAAIFVDSPAQITAALARPAASWHSSSPALVAMLERDAANAFAAARFDTAAKALPLPDGDEPAAAVVAEAKLAAARQSGSAAKAQPDRAVIARLAARLPDTRLRTERGVATWRAYYVLGIGGVDPGFARELAPKLAESVAAIVKTSRQRAFADTVLYPGPATARAAAQAMNSAALARLDANDVAALDAYYASPSGEARADALVAIYRRANDDAATDLLQRFLSRALVATGS